MQYVKCSRDMADHISKACSAPDAEYYVFEASEYAAGKRCNRLWVTAKNLYWAMAKVEALGTVGTEYAVISRAEYNSRFED